MSAVMAYFYEPAAALAVSGEDACAFLQSQFSNDLAPAGPGRSTYGLWLDRKGKVQADGWVLCHGEESYYIHSYFSTSSTIREKLESHIIADDVEVSAAKPSAALSIFGVGSEDFLLSAGAEVPGSGQFCTVGNAIVFCGRRSNRPSFEIVSFDAASAERWAEAVGTQDVQVVSELELQTERIRNGIPAIPVDIGSADLPAEGGLEADALSFTKGCFIGQEVVARMHHLGRSQRGLCRVSGGDPVPQVPAPLHVENGRPVGELRSLVAVEKGWTGLALLKRRVAVSSERVYLGDVPVTIDADLPGSMMNLS